MSQETRLVQVKLTQDLVNGQRENVCWIDARFARLGKLVRGEDDGECWSVSEIYGYKTVEDLQHLVG